MSLVRFYKRILKVIPINYCLFHYMYFLAINRWPWNLQILLTYHIFFWHPSCWWLTQIWWHHELVLPMSLHFFRSSVIFAHTHSGTSEDVTMWSVYPVGDLSRHLLLSTLPCIASFSILFLRKTSSNLLCYLRSHSFFDIQLFIYSHNVSASCPRNSEKTSTTRHLQYIQYSNSPILCLIKEYCEN